MIIRKHNKYINMRDMDNDLDDVIANNIEIVKIKDMNDLLDNIAKISNSYYNECRFYKDKDISYDIFYVEDKTKIENEICHQIFGFNIVSDVLIVKTDNNKFKDMTKYEIKDIFETIMIKKGVLIKSNGDIDEFTYMDNPFERIKDEDMEYDMNYTTIELGNKIICVHLKESSEVNSEASMLLEKEVRGDIIITLVFLLDKCNKYIDISIDKEFYNKLKQCLINKNITNHKNPYKS